MRVPSLVNATIPIEIVDDLISLFFLFHSCMIDLVREGKEELSPP